jgi:hypothetical protein
MHRHLAVQGASGVDIEEEDLGAAAVRHRARDANHRRLIGDVDGTEQRPVRALGVPRRFALRADDAFVVAHDLPAAFLIGNDERRVFCGDGRRDTRH